MQTQITHRCVIEVEIKELGEKPLRRPPSSNRSTRQSVGIHGLARDPPSLIYPLYLSPPSSYSNKASWNCVLSNFPDLVIAPCCICHPWFLPMLPNNSKSTHYTLKRCGLYLGTNLLSRYDNGDGWRRGYNDFSPDSRLKREFGNISRIHSHLI